MPKSKTQEKPKAPKASKIEKSKNPKTTPKSQDVSQNPPPPKQAENESKIDEKPPEVPELVKELKKRGMLKGGISWPIGKGENQKKDNKKRSKPVCYRFDEKYMLLKYDHCVTLRKIEAPRTTTIRLAMMKAKIYPKRGFGEYDEITEKPDSEEDPELDKMREEARRKRYEKLRKSMELIESKTKSKNTTKIEKTSEFKKSYYQLPELNERSCYYLESSKSAKLPENSESLNALDKTDKEVPKDVKLPGDPEKVSEDVKESIKKEEKTLEPVQSSYVAQGLNQGSDYCSLTMKTEDGVQKTSTNSEVCSTRKSDVEEYGKKKTD